MALVVTIVVLIILATISINAVMGEDGLIRRAERAGQHQLNAEANDRDSLDEYDQHIANVLAGVEENGGGETPTEPDNTTGGDEYLDNVLPTAPKLAEIGMTAVKYNNTSGKWEKVIDTSTEWYNYDSNKKEWANVVLGDATFVIENGVEVLDEDEPYSQLVWIPRYAYKITSEYHTSGSTAGNIDIVFIDTANKDKNGTEYTRNSAAEYPSVVNGAMSDYVVHPAFDYGETKIEGFWVGKFESSHTNCTTDVTTGQETFTGNEVITVRANVTSWRNISIGNSFEVCLKMNEDENVYGLSSDDGIVDPHMTKNSEWGAVAYLSQSIYGKNEEIWINNNSSYITGRAGNSVSQSSGKSTGQYAYNTQYGMKASTTGNVTGIYDMSGGNWERVAAYVKNGHDNLITNGAKLVASGTASKYRDEYVALNSNGEAETGGSDSEQKNYEAATPINGKYGDAMYETSSSYVGENSWYRDSSFFCSASSPFFCRGGLYDYDTIAGAFSFYGTAGSGHDYYGFRVSITVF